MAEPLAAPGDTRLRHDLQLLNDSGAINIPLTAWPMALGDVNTRREFLHVDDLADVCIHLMANYSSADIINVGWGERHQHP